MSKSGWITLRAASAASLALGTFAVGCAVAGLYWATHRRDGTLSWSFISTLVLLSIVIAMVTQVIGDSVARAFSLVGALSIVRFRTIVEDTRDTAFVIVAVVAGMAVGLGHIEVAMVGLAVVTLACGIAMSRRAAANGAAPYWRLRMRLGAGYTPDALLAEPCGRYFDASHMTSAASSRQGAALDVEYRVQLRHDSDPAAIITDLNLTDGVQSAELRRD